MEISVPQIGSSHVDYYIDGVLINTVDTTITENDQAAIVVTNAVTSTTQSFTEPVSDYVISGETTTVPALSTRASTFLGKITYNPFCDSLGVYRTYYLNIYQEAIKSAYEYKTLNAGAGALASVVISVIAATLVAFCPELATVAEQLLFSAASAAGTTIIGGVIQGAISKTYYVYITYYDVTAIYPPLSRERTFEGERYRVALSGGGFSSKYCYDGYLPWNNKDVARAYYETSFGASYYPGVQSFS